jgi:L-alanine-DL-glutamate epimerase-like enolase superfamily enzyme
MKISDVKIYPVKGRHWPRFPMVFVEVETDAGGGLVGLGESLSYKSTGVVESLREVGEYLVGKNPFQIELHFETLYRRGVNPAALSGIETALWDIVGQACGQPIYNLLGGKCRDRIRVYCDGFFRGAGYVQDEYAQKAAEAVAQGYTALKMDVDEPIPMANRFNRQISAADLEHMARMVESVRDTVGPHVDLAVDAHGAFDVAAAVRLGTALEPYKLLWIEDPIPMENMAALAKVSRETLTPICTGELLVGRIAFRELFERQAADIVMPDLARAGGILEMKKIAALADTYYVPIAPHNMVGPVATIASAHLCACVPNFLILEYQLGDVPYVDELISAPVPIRDGHLDLFTAPGLGVSLNHAAAEKYRAE